MSYYGKHVMMTAQKNLVSMLSVRKSIALGIFLIIRSSQAWPWEFLLFVSTLSTGRMQINQTDFAFW